MEINRGTFVSADTDTKLLIMFDILTAHVESQVETCTERKTECDKKFKILEQRKSLDTALTVTGGFIGGFVAIVAKAKFWD